MGRDGEDGPDRVVGRGGRARRDRVVGRGGMGGGDRLVGRGGRDGRDGGGGGGGAPFDFGASSMTSGNSGILEPGSDGAIEGPSSAL